MANKTTKICAGEYTRTDGKNTVAISYIPELDGWIAAANWDNLRYTDPIATKRDAIYNADLMLADA